MGKKRDVFKTSTGPYHRDGRPVKFKIGWGVRKVVIKRDGFVCRYCNAVLTYETHTIDHIIPASAGGTEDVSNLVMCCANCNKRAKNLVFPNFKAKRDYLLKSKKGSDPNR